MKYLPFLTLQLKHTYYSDGCCPDFEITPTIATRKLLNNYRAILKPLSNGLQIFISVSQENNTFTPFIPLANDIKFTFQLRLQNSDFALFTDMADFSQIAAPLYTNANVNAGNPTQLALVSNQGQSSLAKNGAFADVEIIYNDTFRDIATGASAFEIMFNAKKARWNYYLVCDNTNAKFSIEDKDASPLVFSDRNQTDLSQNPDDSDDIATLLADRYPNKQRLRFISDDLIACQQQARKSLQLILKNDPVLTPLPNPKLQNYKTMSITKNGNLQKEDALFQIVKYFTP